MTITEMQSRNALLSEEILRLKAEIDRYRSGAMAELMRHELFVEQQDIINRLRAQINRQAVRIKELAE